MGAVFLDINGAFDNVLCDLLLQKLSNLGFPTNTLSFISNLICRRQVFCRYGDIDEVLQAHKGLPQGSVLSLLLYALYVKDIDQPCIFPGKILQYADDVALYSRGPNTRLCLNQLKRAPVSSIFLEKLYLSLSPNKTNLCLFGKLGIIRKNRSVSIKTNR